MAYYKWLISGDTTTDKAKALRELIRRAGFDIRVVMGATLPEPKLSRDELAAFDLVRDLLDKPEPGEPSWRTLDNRRWDTRVLHGLAGGRTALHLTQRAFLDFVTAQEELCGLYDWKIAAALLRFMIKQGIRFKDVNPSTFNPLPTGRLTTRHYNALRREGLEWADLFAYVRRYDLLDIKGFGLKGFDVLIPLLADEYGVTLKA